MRTGSLRSASRSSRRDMSEPSYLYAVARGMQEPPPDVTGIHGLPLRTVPVRDLCAVTSQVDLAEFGSEPLRRNLENMGWLEEIARTHDEVVRAIAAQAATAPLRLATICV